MTSLSQAIVDEVHHRAEQLPELPEVSMVAISLGFTLVELANGVCGISFTPRSQSGSCAHYNGAGSLSTRTALSLCRLMCSEKPLEKCVGAAAVNALSRLIMDAEPQAYPPSKKDILDLLPLDGGHPTKVGMVGHIGPFIPFLAERADALVVVDDNPFLTAGKASYKVSRSLSDLSRVDILLVTGSSAAAGDLEAAISAAPAARFIGVVGPSAGWLPEPLFRRGVTAVGAMKITDTAGVKRAVLEGGGTPHFMGFCQKYTLVNPEQAPTG